MPNCKDTTISGNYKTHSVFLLFFIILIRQSKTTRVTRTGTNVIHIVKILACINKNVYFC